MFGRESGRVACMMRVDYQPACPNPSLGSSPNPSLNGHFSGLEDELS